MRAGRDLKFDANASVYTGGSPGEATHVFTSWCQLSVAYARRAPRALRR
jgi:hypothetical protein